MTVDTFPILTLITFLPLVGAVAVARRWASRWNASTR